MGLGLVYLMKITDKAIKDVVSEVAGLDVLPLVTALKDKKNISEFELARQINCDINPTRNMLYRLHNNNLVTFTRKKDKQKGWYIYYWTFNAKQIKHASNLLKKKKIEQHQERLKRERSTNFFLCINKCLRLDFEQSTDFNFKCPECGELLHQQDNSEKIKEIEKQLSVLTGELITTTNPESLS